MDTNTIYFIGVPMLLFEAWFMSTLANFAKEKSLTLIYTLYVAMASSICLNGITKMLTPYTGVLLAALISLSIIFVFIYGCLTTKAGLGGKASFLITTVYLGVDLVIKAILFVLSVGARA